MDINAYIESGVLELYVAGQLSEQENQEVYELMLKHPELLQEVLSIEAAIIKLTAATSSNKNENTLQRIKDQLKFGNASKVVQMSKPKTNWFTYTGWAAALFIGAGLLWTLNQNKELEAQLSDVDTEKAYLETQIEQAKTNLAVKENLLNVLRDRDIITVPLGGQGSFANSYAKVYWNKSNNNIYLDAQGLPEAPEGKVWQVWSLTLNPLTPKSLGTITDFNTDENKIFTIANANESEAFGITLEPTGGSPTPTMEQLHTLGVVTP
ncbi:anti-sigma factor [Psychroserpens ponticola]|uniref:Anti-sigma factor n=1 Tax=Psychroserpens ponticola TaxID=2932268 RepID=A0ABY7RUC9_9FLAO|nr:anti-sigma factor [Psychroserpens ponticola]WCO00714.1 anti-sigma factor [Psychroserpens ponticola]